jgi:hypothetical protein
MVRNGQHAPRHIESFRPKMQKRLFAVSSNFPGWAARERNAAAILMQILKAGGQEFFQARFEFRGKIHRPIITK